MSVRSATGTGAAAAASSSPRETRNFPAATPQDGLPAAAMLTISHLGSASAHRLAVQDAALSRRKHGFESRWACQLFWFSSTFQLLETQRVDPVARSLHHLFVTRPAEGKRLPPISAKGRRKASRPFSIIVLRSTWNRGARLRAAAAQSGRVDGLSDLDRFMAGWKRSSASRLRPEGSRRPVDQSPRAVRTHCSISGRFAGTGSPHWRSSDSNLRVMPVLP